MSPRFVIPVFVLLILVCAVSNIAYAEENSNSQMAPPMTPITAGQDPANTVGVIPLPRSSSNGVPSFITRKLNLLAFEAGAGDLSLCNGDADCMEDARRIQSDVCAFDVCHEGNSTRSPLDCLAVRFPGDQNGIAASMCALIKSPDSGTRKEFLRYVSDPNVTEDSTVEMGAFIMALKTSAEACTNYIKNYIGPYSPNVKKKWYWALSGCRILSHESTREEEEKDFFTWYKAMRGEGRCADIGNEEIRKACEDVGRYPFDDREEKESFPVGGQNQHAMSQRHQAFFSL